MTLRNWCATASFGEGFEDFVFGMVQAATELEAERELKSAWRSISPHPVTFLAVIPGTLAFASES